MVPGQSRRKETDYQYEFQIRKVYNATQRNPEESSKVENSIHIK
jgi:hypothetical protein